MYISTKDMVISIICNACGVLGFILWAIEAYKSNASQRKPTRWKRWVAKMKGGTENE